MKRAIGLTRRARAEFDAAIDWYEAKRPGLGGQFAAKVDTTFRRILRTPRQFPVAESDLREAPVEGFPYWVYYREAPNRVTVVAVFHQSRDPSGWMGR